MDTGTAILPIDELTPDLSATEQQFLYQLEVIGLPVLRAAEIAGVKSPYAVLKKPHIIAGREQYRRAVQGRTDFSRDDIIAGMKGAIDQASILGDPMAQIAGWREIAKLKGYDKQPSVSITLTGTIDQVTKQVKTMSTEQLIELAGGEGILDADFYRVVNDAAPDRD